MTRDFIAAVIVVSSFVLIAEGMESITVASDKAVREVRIDRLLGGNVALWYQPEDLGSKELETRMNAWKPTLLRLPGGSWSDEFYWNGNGVRSGSKIDSSKFKDGAWQVDYSGYAPGIHLAKTDGTLADFHGHIDVRGLHEFVKSRGAEAVVTVNAGTGTPEMAAEWVRWAKAQAYPVAYWEVGNELDGEWELGHFRKDGKPMDAAAYVSRYLEIAKAMKAVDPSIKVGGPTCSSDQLPFVEELIRDGGELVDFVSFHTYPVLGARANEAERMASADHVRKAVEKIRSWISKYQPERADKIEIGVSEWHKQVMETRATVDLTSGIWGCLFIGAMAGSGVDFANEWDFFSTTDSGGHGLFDKSGGAPRAMFHAMTLWRDMGDKLIKSESPGKLRCFATLKAETVELLVVNPTRKADRFSLTIDGRKVTDSLNARRLSQREYFWNPLANRPEWTTGPRVVTLEIAQEGFPIGPLTALRMSIPLDGVIKRDLVALEEAGAKLDILLPESAPADLPVEGFVVVRDTVSGGPFLGTIPEVRLEVQGAKVSHAVVDTAESVGRFELSATNPGDVTVTASTADGLSATRVIKLSAVQERNEILWGFPDEASVKSLETNYVLSLDRAARPNQSVAAVSLAGATGEAQKNTLLAIREFPKNLQRDRIGGLCGKVGVSADFASEDPNAAVQIVLQSNHDHWIQVGNIPLSELKGTWKDLAVRFTDPAVLAAMSEIYAVRLHLKTHKPVTGRIYVDDLGFILRGNP